MDKQFDDLIMTELSDNLKDDLLELFDNYDNDEVYDEYVRIEKMLKERGF